MSSGDEIISDNKDIDNLNVDRAIDLIVKSYLFLDHQAKIEKLKKIGEQCIFTKKTYRDHRNRLSVDANVPVKEKLNLLSAYGSLNEQLSEMYNKCQQSIVELNFENNDRPKFVAISELEIETKKNALKNFVISLLLQPSQGNSSMLNETQEEDIKKENESRRKKEKEKKQDEMENTLISLIHYPTSDFKRAGNSSLYNAIQEEKLK